AGVGNSGRNGAAATTGAFDLRSGDPAVREENRLVQPAGETSGDRTVGDGARRASTACAGEGAQDDGGGRTGRCAAGYADLGAGAGSGNAQSNAAAQCGLGCSGES